MKREFSMLMKDLEGGRRVTRSYNKGSLLENLCTGSSGCLNADSPIKVGTGGHPSVRKSAQDSVTRRSGVRSQGKLTNKDLGMHRNVLTEDVLPDGAALYYVVQGEKRLEGYKKDGGIFCTCCNTVVSASQFEAHAGYASRRKPYNNIYTSNGLSLHKLAIEISRNDTSTAKQNDDLCYMYEYGGDMLFCKTCPQGSPIECHHSRIPQETLYCRHCQDMFEMAKLEERSANAIAAGRVPGSDPLKDIAQPCIHIAETSTLDIGGCTICSGHDITKNAFDDRTVIICDQAPPKDNWFCCQLCNYIKFTLLMITEMGELKFQESIINTVKNKSEQVLDMNPKLDIKFRLLKGRGATGATRKLLYDVVSIFRDRFYPIADSTTASLDLIPHLVFGMPFKGQDYGGMLCAILMVNSVVVSTAIFRVFGAGIAEMPLIATKSDYERKGYFQLLFNCFEQLLAYNGVKDLVLPAADETESYWIDKFGFKKLDLERASEYKKNHQHIMIFREMSILHKSITK